MLDFTYRTEATINADPKVVFDLVSDPALHVELAGSGELNVVKQMPLGEIGLGTRLLVDETVKLVDGTGMDVSSDSVIVAFDPPKCISWIVSAVTMPEQPRRVQWWFTLTPAGRDSTHVAHEVEVDFGEPQDEMLRGLKENYEQIRAPLVRTGMERTLENVRKLAER
ncbi:MAG TPA: SRPBCC family protein [Acidimicrobiales bacterium]|nr:SRPBCC family protein [Acidimicrobiales bacterium]